jgi:hypothetical protein
MAWSIGMKGLGLQLPVPTGLLLARVTLYYMPFFPAQITCNLKMEAPGSSETLISIYQMIWCHIPADHKLKNLPFQHPTMLTHSHHCHCEKEE